jgi:peptide-methionine (S)-S-oxide reductase
MPEELQNPSYEQVLTILVMLKLLPYYDPKVISFKELVNVFFASQDPTTPNQQGPDRSSYRSIAFIKMQQRRKLLKIKLRAYSQ